jgi:hypothetical protein
MIDGKGHVSVVRKYFSQYLEVFAKTCPHKFFLHLPIYNLQSGRPYPQLDGIRPTHII